MAELSQPFSCDVCGVHKGDQNHWFKVWRNPVGIVSISVWGLKPAGQHFHCCGEQHAIQKAGELLAGLGSVPSIDPPPPAAAPSTEKSSAEQGEAQIME
jgi:hypothetical protein